jgi:hypothetical protein
MFMPFAAEVVAVVELVRSVIVVGRAPLGRAPLGSARVEVRKKDMRRGLKSILVVVRVDWIYLSEMKMVFCLV